MPFGAFERVGCSNGVGQHRVVACGCGRVLVGDVVPLIRDHFGFFDKEDERKEWGGAEAKGDLGTSIDRRVEEHARDVANAPMQPGGTQSYRGEAANDDEINVHRLIAEC